MVIRLITQRFLRFALVLTLASAPMTIHAQQTKHDVTDVDLAKIVEAALHLAFHPDLAFHPARIGIAQNLSSENIEFESASRLRELGFVLLNAYRMRILKSDQSVDYVVFRRIVAQDGVVTVSLSHVVESRPCFGRPSSSERNFTYEFRREAGEWNGQLVHRPELRRSLDRSLLQR